MWTKENRGRYDRSQLRYPSDLTDEEWTLVEPLIAPAKRGGNKRTVSGVLVMATLFGLHPFLLKLYADGGYQGPIFQSAVRKILRQIDVEIVKRSDLAKGFSVLPKRWIVERTIAWLNRCRRLAKDWECLNRKALAFLRLASIRLMLRKLCQKTS